MRSSEWFAGLQSNFRIRPNLCRRCLFLKHPFFHQGAWWPPRLERIWKSLTLFQSQFCKLHGCLLRSNAADLWLLKTSQADFYVANSIYQLIGLKVTGKKMTSRFGFILTLIPFACVKVRCAKFWILGACFFVIIASSIFKVDLQDKPKINSDYFETWMSINSTNSLVLES